jgi:hypothetical protein
MKNPAATRVMPTFVGMTGWHGVAFQPFSSPVAHRAG